MLLANAGLFHSRVAAFLSFAAKGIRRMNSIMQSLPAYFEQDGDGRFGHRRDENGFL